MVSTFCTFPFSRKYFKLKLIMKFYALDFNVKNIDTFRIDLKKVAPFVYDTDVSILGSEEGRTKDGVL